jgi:hypothetical protein
MIVVDEGIAERVVLVGNLEHGRLEGRAFGDAEALGE